MADPENILLVDSLKSHLFEALEHLPNIQLYHCDPAQIENAIDSLYHSHNSLMGIQDAATEMVESILVHAIRKGASDLHFQPENQTVTIRYRLDGILRALQMDFESRNIMTLEEPVEYQLPGIRQTEIKEGGIIDFADGVRSILRQDPDVIFIGEIRDEETAKMALRSAMTGLEPSLLAGNIICAVAQRLVRKCCADCKAKGCETCDQLGYKGPDEKRAWHAGISHWNGKDNVNNFSIGIELQNHGYNYFLLHGYWPAYPLDIAMFHPIENPNQNAILPKSQSPYTLKLSTDPLSLIHSFF
eukprot:gene15687-15839_t